MLETLQAFSLLKIHLYAQASILRHKNMTTLCPFREKSIGYVYTCVSVCVHIYFYPIYIHMYNYL